MNTIYSILVSDGAVALHFLLTMVLLVMVILRGIQTETKLRRVAAENIDLKRQLSELADFTSNCIQDIRSKMDLHSDAICHTVDYVSGVVDLDTSRFSALHNETLQDDSFSGTQLISVDLVGDGQEPDLSTADSAFVAPDPDHLEPDVSMPLRASMITMPGDADDAVVEELQERSDIMTRVLQQSRGH